AVLARRSRAVGVGLPLARGRRRGGFLVVLGGARAEVDLAEGDLVLAVAVQAELHHEPPGADPHTVLLGDEREVLAMAQEASAVVVRRDHGLGAGLGVPAPLLGVHRAPPAA
uniref:Uncharacterized protein n=1 Tax=Triticum urartu TaxID=4572 RepID=A0A8R7PTS9_TRIUA